MKWKLNKTKYKWYLSATMKSNEERNIKISMQYIPNQNTNWESRIENEIEEDKEDTDLRVATCVSVWVDVDVGSLLLLVLSYWTRNCDENEHRPWNDETMKWWNDESFSDIIIRTSTRHARDGDSIPAWEIFILFASSSLSFNFGVQSSMNWIHMIWTKWSSFKFVSDFVSLIH
jgi:predicted CopG family antitoxin